MGGWGGESIILAAEKSLSREKSEAGRQSAVIIQARGSAPWTKAVIVELLLRLGKVSPTGFADRVQGYQRKKNQGS